MNSERIGNIRERVVQRRCDILRLLYHVILIVILMGLGRYLSADIIPTGIDDGY